MKVLIIHKSFPGQFAPLATFLAHEGHQVVFLTAAAEGSLPGVHKLVYQPHRTVRPETHKYVRTFEDAVLHGQGAYRAAMELKARGFVPDVIYGHSGWGPTLYMKDAFPDIPLVCYFEWFYHAHGSDSDFGPDEVLTADEECMIRTKNAKILLDLSSCNAGVSPMFWQQKQFPPEFAGKIRVLRDGVNTSLFSPKEGAKLVIPEISLDLSQAKEVVTYVTRAMEPYRGFPQFMEAVSLLQKRRPHCHVVVIGDDRVEYGQARTDGKTYKEYLLEQFPFDQDRLHFTGFLPYMRYREVLQASDVHVYLTRPFVLSWSFLDAMASGCSVVASSTPPVQEVIQHKVNGCMVDFFSPKQLAEQMEELLDDRRLRAAIGYRARATILQHFDLAYWLPKQVEFLQEISNKKRL